MSKATFERRVVSILYDFQKARKVWNDLVGDGLTQANTLVNVQLQQGAGYWPPALEQFVDLKDRFESKLQKKADALAVDFETTFTKMLQTSQFEYLMEEATETFGEAFTYKEPIGTTCTMEQIWVELERVFGLYSLQIALNREILDALVARNQNLDHAKILSGGGGGATAPSGSTSTEASLTSLSSSEQQPRISGFNQIPIRRDKDQGMILLSAWLNQPHLKTDTLLTFDEFCQVELFGSE
ncbi:hypothetical protein BGZ93_008358 [Podila epicladia]|nr:hypothetical protein BGZ93_008358 [Podila epicladia]